MMDKKFLKAYIIKAEALFQICQFEHALLIFHRGQVIDYISFEKKTSLSTINIYTLCPRLIRSDCYLGSSS